jgi:hypothetical protein
MGLNAALGWWWEDPVAALGMTYFLVSEGREAWRVLFEHRLPRALVYSNWIGAAGTRLDCDE